MPCAVHVLFQPVEVGGIIASTRVRTPLLPRTGDTSQGTSTSGGTSGETRGSAPSTIFKGVARSRGAEPVEADAGEADVGAGYRLVDGVVEKCEAVGGGGEGEGQDSGSSVCNILSEHEARWLEIDAKDSTYPAAVSYLLRRINVDRDLSPILDPEELRKLAYAIYRYRNKITEPDAQDLKYFADQTGLAGSGAERWRAGSRSKWDK